MNNILSKMTLKLVPMNSTNFFHYDIWNSEKGKWEMILWKKIKKWKWKLGEEEKKNKQPCAECNRGTWEDGTGSESEAVEE